MTDMGCDSFERGERLVAKAERAKIAHEEKEKQVKWVVSKYAPETGERFEVLAEYDSSYRIRVHRADRWYNLDAPKDEYIPCPPPERWEKVPINCVIHNHGDTVEFVIQHIWVWALTGHRFTIIDGALVLERRVQ